MSEITIQPLRPGDRPFRAEVAKLLVETWPDSYLERAETEVENCLEAERIALIAVENGTVVGFVGAIPQYGKTGWELHPLLVKKTRRFCGIGALLLCELESKVAEKGGITIYLGSDDVVGATSLANTELYEDTFDKIQNVQNLKHHPYEFYQKLGYKIVGVIPDANGIGKPDIWMAKRVNAHR